MAKSYTAYLTGTYELRYEIDLPDNDPDIDEMVTIEEVQDAVFGSLPMELCAQDSGWGSKSPSWSRSINNEDLFMYEIIDSDDKVIFEEDTEIQQLRKENAALRDQICDLKRHTSK